MREQITSVLICSFQVLIGLCLTAIVSRILPLADYGLYASFTASILILAVLAQAGIPDIVLRETAAQPKAASETLLRGWKEGDLASVPSLLLAFALGAGVALYALGERLTPLLALGLALHLPLMTLLALRAGALRGLGKPNPAHVVMSILPGLTAVLLMLLALGTGILKSLEGAMLANASGILIAVLVSHALRQKGVSRATVKTEAENRRALRRAALPVAGIAGLGIFNAQSDVMMLAALDGVTSSGIYQAALQVVIMLTILRARSGMIPAREIMQRWKQGDLAGVERAAGPSAAIVSGTALIFLIPSLFVGGDILAFLFGEDFRAGAPVLILACTAQLIAGMTGMAGYLLILTGHQSKTLLASIGSALINICLNPPLISALGPIGAAISLFLSVIFWAVFVWIQAKRIGIDTSILAWARHHRACRKAALAPAPAE